MATQVDASASASGTGTLIAGKYRLEAELGRGGMGAVYAARHVLTGRRFAIKLLSRELTGNEGAEERFMREALLANSIQHPAIVEVYDVGRDRGVPYMVMKLLEGETLGRRLERGPLPVEQAIALLLPVVDGIAAAHAHGIVHRDLKPDNVLIEREGDRELPRVLDFGIGKLLDGDARRPAITRPGMIIGTPEYMAPEQVHGDVVLDARCDVYALGVMLFEMLTGSVPFGGSDLGSLLRMISQGTPPRVRSRRPELSDALDDLVARALATRREHRYADAAELGRALSALPEAPQPRNSSDRSLLASSTELPALERTASRRSLTPGPGVYAGALLGALLLAVALALVAHHEPRSTPAAAVALPAPAPAPTPAPAPAPAPAPPPVEPTAPQLNPTRPAAKRPRKVSVPHDAPHPAPKRSLGMPSLTSEILDPFE